MHFQQRVVLALTILIIASGFQLRAQVDSTFRTYFYDQRYSLFSVLPERPGAIIMLGNSITNGANWHEMFNNPKVINRGISGDNTFGILNRLDEITASQPEKIFLLIGINDLSKDTPVEVVLTNYRKIIEEIQKQTPSTAIYVQSIMPTGKEGDFEYFPNAYSRVAAIRAVNEGIKKLASSYGLTFIDLYPHFADERNHLDKKYTNDGLHLTGEGYKLWADILQPYIEEKVSHKESQPESGSDLYYQRKRAMHEALPMPPAAVVMFGNSITEHGLWSELLPGAKVVNRGIGGDNLTGMKDRMPDIASRQPEAIFIMAGINNILFYDAPPETVAAKSEDLLQLIRRESPRTRIFVQSILPVNDLMDPGNEFLQNRNHVIKETNLLLEQIARQYALTYIDLYSLFIDNEGRMNEKYSIDGIHLNGKGYLLWARTIQPYLE